jgi:uncharacterized protein YlxW (UPF0749 family)
VIKYSNQSKILLVIAILIFLLLLVNTVLVARTIGVVQFPGELSRVDIARQGALMSLELSEQMAKDANVYDTSTVREVLAQYKYEIDKATSAENIVSLISEYSLKVQDVILREQDSKRRDTVFAIINDDKNLSLYKGDAVISIWKSDEGIRIDDPTNLISEETKELLNENPLLQASSWSLIELSVSDGQISLMTSRSMLDKLKMLENEKANLERALKQLKSQAGYADLSGTGIVVEMYDSTYGFSSIDIVHDRDVRDVVNELFAAGASGISVGGQRLTTTSSIRCAGPIILVNQKPIAVDPIVIHAVGDPVILASSLELIKAELNEFGIRIEIKEQEQITLPPFAE